MAEHGFVSPDGEYWVTISDPPADLVASYPEGTLEVGLRPTPLHTWNFTKGDWNTVPQEQIDKMYGDEIRDERDARLMEHVDRIVSNPLRWESMTTEQQDKVKAYRTALLDLTKQVGFPTSFTWPEKFVL